MEKELYALKEDTKTKIHIELLRATLEKVSNWKTPGPDGIYGYWFKKFFFIQDWLGIKIDSYLE